MQKVSLQCAQEKEKKIKIVRVDIRKEENKNRLRGGSRYGRYCFCGINYRDAYLESFAFSHVVLKLKWYAVHREWK